MFTARVLSKLDGELKHCVIAEVREHTVVCPRIHEAVVNWCGPGVLSINYRSVEAPIEEATGIVDAISRTKRGTNWERCREAYEDFKRQTRAMWRLLTDGLGVTVEVWDERWGFGDDAYESAAQQVHDLIVNRHLWINRGEFFIGEDRASDTGTNHPWMTAEEYFRFRAVHDAFGHASVGAGFDRHGEYATWIVHWSMYEPPGRDAMTTEYRGVNTFLWMTGQRMPPEHWGILLPEDFRTPKEVK